jgi:hypothetical protein
MPSFEYDATIDPHSSQIWSTGGSGYFTSSQFPQFDVRVVATPAVFTGPGGSPALIYKDFACATQDTFPYNGTYSFTVQNDSDIRLPYKMRIWFA